MASNCFWLSWWRLMGCGGFATGTVVGKMIKFVCRKVEVWLLQTSLIKVLRTQWEKRETNKIKSNKSKRRHRSTVGIMAGHDSELCLLNWIVLWEAIFFFSSSEWLFHYFLWESTSKAVYLVRVFIDSEPVIWVLSLYLMCQGGRQRLRLFYQEI